MCPACAKRRAHLYHAGCKGCEARAVARGPEFHRCRSAGKQDAAYRALLARAGISHAEVVKAAEAGKERVTA